MGTRTGQPFGSIEPATRSGGRAGSRGGDGPWAGSGPVDPSEASQRWDLSCG